MRSVLSSMIAAIDHELAERKGQEGGERRKIRLTRVHSVGRTDGGWLFAGVAGYQARVDEGAEVDVLSNSGALLGVGEILQISFNEVLFVVDSDISRSQSVVLELSDDFILERLAERLAALTGSASSSQLGLSRWLLPGELQAPQRGMGAERESGLADLHRLNRQQNDARATAASHPVSFLWGPPGTGKTTTLGAIVTDYAQAGQRVLLLSNTNVAVDTALRSVCQEFENRGLGSRLEEGAVLRFGQIVRDDVADSYGEWTSMEGQVVQRLGTDAYQVDRELARATKSARAQLDGWKDAPPPEGEPSRAVHEHHVLRRRQSRAWAMEYSLREERRKALRRQIRDQEAAALAGAAVTCTTVYKAYLNKAVFDSHWDAVVVDEASMVPLPAVVLMATKATSSLLIAGDFRQLPPVTEADSPEVLEWLGNDAFHFSGVASAVARGERPAHLSVLSVQHRMAPEISALVSSNFYPEARLVDSDDVRSRVVGTHELLCGPENLLVVDTTDLGPWAARDAWGSPYNLLHGLVSCALAEQAGRTGLLGAEQGVGAVAPFRAQAELLDAAFRGSAAMHSPGTVGQHAGTVHRFQGNEKNVVVLDLTASRPLTIPRWFGEEAIDSTGPRLINVAISRARHQLILLADRSRLKDDDAPIIAKVLEGAIQSGSVVPARDILEGVALFAESLEDVLSSALSTVALQVQSRWAMDNRGLLIAAAERGVKVSLFTNAPKGWKAGPRMRSWAQALETLHQHNVRVYVRDRASGTVCVVDGQRAWVWGRLAPVTQAVGFESHSFAEATLKLLGRRPIYPNSGPFGEAACPACGRILARRSGRSGDYTTCWSESCRQQVDLGRCEDDDCTGWFVLKASGTRHFGGCSMFPECPRTREITESEAEQIRAASPFVADGWN